jgi:hypothetical protein
VHGDVRPSNIRVGPQGQVVLSEAGVGLHRPELRRS